MWLNNLSNVKLRAEVRWDSSCLWNLRSLFNKTFVFNTMYWWSENRVFSEEIWIQRLGLFQEQVSKPNYTVSSQEITSLWQKNFKPGNIFKFSESLAHPFVVYVIIDSVQPKKPFKSLLETCLFFGELRRLWYTL